MASGELRPWDPGLQNERTGLAWQRTMLSGLTCGLVVARLLATFSFTLALLVGLAALGCTAGLGGLAIWRFRRTNVALHAARPVGDGAAPLMLTLLVLLTGLGALAYVVLVH